MTQFKRAMKSLKVNIIFANFDSFNCSFHLTISPRLFKPGSFVFNSQFLALLGKPFAKLTTIICQDTVDSLGTPADRIPEKLKGVVFCFTHHSFDKDQLGYSVSGYQTFSDELSYGEICLGVFMISY